MNKKDYERTAYLRLHNSDDNAPTVADGLQELAAARERIARLELALDAILSIEQHGGDKHSWAGGHDYAVCMVQDIARTAKRGGK